MNNDNFDQNQNYDEVTSYDSVGNRRQIFMATAFSSLMRKVYVWMTLALVVSGLTALYVSGSEAAMQAIFGNRAGFWILAIAELALVIILSARIQRMSFATAGLMFIAYSILNGVTLSFIFLAYTRASIASTFFVTAGTFGAMSLIGYSTKRNLDGLGRYLLYGLIGLIIASVVNLFIMSSPFDFVISIIGVVIFVALTAYDTQKIKQMFLAYGQDVNDSTQKLALLGSLTLYLDFINLFLYLLRFFGKSND